MNRREFAKQNYEKTKNDIGYTPLTDSNEKTYSNIGFKCGLEVHQQLATKKKLFCSCPVTDYHNFEDYDAELIRHMRPTLSELGEYDGTALMEFKTKKEIYYRINNKTTCTYEIDDTPPFPMNREALKYAMEISSLMNQFIVGEVHITRKQYLDGSIPAGFQRTAIIGIEGQIPIKNKNIRIIQLSIEEDSCREISDYKHDRHYITDRLGIPLIETVTYPEMLTPWEAAEAAQSIRFINRSTGHVRTGIGAAREDVNVSVTGGTRIEIKGVAHINWIPKLTHNEAFRQWSLLRLKDKLVTLVKKEDWALSYKTLDWKLEEVPESLKQHANEEDLLITVNLPYFKGFLSHFTQPQKTFENEISDRLKVVACLERPNITSSESLTQTLSDEQWNIISSILESNENDAQLFFVTPKEDLKTAIETIEERCLMAFDGIPQETRKSFEDGTTIFERVLPGADRMYPDTDSAPISVTQEDIDDVQKNLPVSLETRFEQLRKWNVPADAYIYLLRNNLIPIMEGILNNITIDPKQLSTIIAHKIKGLERHSQKNFPYHRLLEMFQFMAENKIEKSLLHTMLKYLIENPMIECESILEQIKFERFTEKEILSNVDYLENSFKRNPRSKHPMAKEKWIMGHIRPMAQGNADFYSIAKQIYKMEEK
jgi:glutamyl-tRNA(Gln) amidotransferase subunit E